MSPTEKKALEKVQQYYNNTLVKNPDRRGKGFDFETSDRNKKIEVKGSKAEKISAVLFRTLTKDEYETAKKCKNENKEYELHLVIGLDSNVEHYIIPGDLIIEKAVKKIHYEMPIRVADFKSLISQGGKIKKII